MGRKLTMLLVDDLSMGRSTERHLRFTYDGQLKIELTDSTETAIHLLSNPFDVLACHISYDDDKIGDFAKRRHGDNILAIGYSSGGLVDHWVKPMGYDIFLESGVRDPISRQIQDSFPGVDGFILKRFIDEQLQEFLEN